MSPNTEFVAEMKTHSWVDRIRMSRKHRPLKPEGSPMLRAIALIAKRRHRLELLCEVLRKKGAVILSDRAAPGGFDAVVMMGSATAGVVDARRDKSLSAERQNSLRARSEDMGFLTLMVVHSNTMTPLVEGVIYCFEDDVAEPEKDLAPAASSEVSL